jgi:DNA-binding protein H-NS
MASYQDILKQIENLQQQAEEVRKQELAGAIAEVKRIMAQYDLTAADLGFGARVGKAKVKNAVAPKYRDPASGSTWTGRGRRPAWVVALEASGKSLDSCRI